MYIELPQTSWFVCQSRRDRFDIASGAAAASWLQDGLEPECCFAWKQVDR